MDMKHFAVWFELLYQTRKDKSGRKFWVQISPLLSSSLIRSWPWLALGWKTVEAMANCLRLSCALERNTVVVTSQHFPPPAVLVPVP